MTEEEYEKIKKNCEDWASKYLGSGFKFREYQLDTIVKLVNNVINSKKVQVVEAPTGSGKSLIAMITAGTLEKYYNKSSYILVSDTSLFAQYEADVKKYKLNWGCISGKDNYQCSQNGLPFSSGRCQCARKTVKYLVGLKHKADSESSFAQCCKTCKYINDLERAHTSKVTIATYQLWCVSAINQKDDFLFHEKLFSRDLIIGDEAHKLQDIIQSIYSPRINLLNNKNIELINELYDNRKDEIHSILDGMISDKDNQKPDDIEPNSVDDFIQIKSAIFEAVKTSAPKEMIFKLLNAYKNMLGILAGYSMITYRVSTNEKFTPDSLRYIKAANAIASEHSILDSYISNTEDNLRYMVSTLNSDESEVSFHSANESKLVYKFFHLRASQEILMSATIGDLDTYRELIGASIIPDDAFYAVGIPSTFDYSKSPIYYNQNLRLSYKEKAKNLPLIVKQIEDIVNKHVGERGIIHTGSYEFTNFLKNNVSPECKSRMLFYNNTTEKKHILAQFETKKDKILVGPSMIEGISLDYDKSRFLIIMKTPFASLGDKLVKAKMDLYPKWYAYDVGAKIVQALGRGVRAKDDWCVSYILDACFADLLDRNPWLFDDIVKSRLVKVE